MQQVTVRIPASTSNLGPGFDCLGVALSLYNRITVSQSKHGAVSGMVRDAARKFFAATECKAFEFACDIKGKIPIARGLGSSVTVRLGVLHALNKIARTNLTRHDLFTLCAELEGHPDNSAPASFGGFTLVRGAEVQHFNVSPQLAFVLLIPNFQIATNEARLKRRSRHEKLFESLEEFQTDDKDHEFMPHDFADWREIPSETLERKEVRYAVGAALHKLPEIYREIFILRDVEELNISECCEILGISEQTVKVRLHRARLRIREELAPVFKANWLSRVLSFKGKKLW